MVELKDKVLALKVIKRKGKKVDFDGAKIAVAIKKGFDSICVEDEENKYDEKDIQKVYKGVIKRIEKEYANEDKIKIETIQDMIEDESIDISKDVEEKLMTEFIISEMKRCLTKEEYIILYLRIIREFSIQDVLKFMNINKKKSMTKSQVIDLETKAKKDLAHKSTYFKEKYKHYISEIESKIDFKYMASAEDVAMERLSIINKFNLLNNIISNEPM